MDQRRWEVTLGEEEGSADLVQGTGEGGIAERDRQMQRKHISIQLSRGQKLSTKLVEELGLGILFSPKIW